MSIFQKWPKNTKYISKPLIFLLISGGALLSSLTFCNKWIQDNVPYVSLLIISIIALCVWILTVLISRNRYREINQLKETIKNLTKEKDNLKNKKADLPSDCDYYLFCHWNEHKEMYSDCCHAKYIPQKEPSLYLCSNCKTKFYLKSTINELFTYRQAIKYVDKKRQKHKTGVYKHNENESLY